LLLFAIQVLTFRDTALQKYRRGFVATLHWKGVTLMAVGCTTGGAMADIAISVEAGFNGTVVKAVGVRKTS
jgi:hypothetical protein